MNSTVVERRATGFDWRFLGLLAVIFSEAATLAHVEPFAIYNTPIAWTGYILFADAIVTRRTGRSLMTSRPREFAMMVVWSVPAWLIFEGFNLRLHNWHYVGLPANPIIAGFGYVWAFATVLPGVLETVDLLESFGVGDGWTGRPFGITPSRENVWMALGLIFLVVPLVVPEAIGAYLFGFVWIGFIILLDPLLHRLRGRSLLGLAAAGDYRRLGRLLIAGAICGLLWESWNYWAIGKWIYDVPAPLGLGPKIFEMPILGFPGFLPFAVECEELQNVAVWVARRAGWSIEPDDHIELPTPVERLTR